MDMFYLAYRLEKEQLTKRTEIFKAGRQNVGMSVLNKNHQSLSSLYVEIA